MFQRKDKNKNAKIDIPKLNDVIGISKNILKIVYVLSLIICIYVITKLFKELKIMDNIIVILKIILPLFIGFFIAWLFDPFVSWLQRKGMRRTFGTTLTYIIFIGLFSVVIGSLIPVLFDQINDFASSIPAVSDSVLNWVDGVFDKLNNIEQFDAESVKNNIFETVKNIGSDLTLSLPDKAIELLKSLFSGIGNIIVGLIIGFFLLINFNNVSDSIITLFPKKMQNDTRDIFNEVNTSFRKFINGALLDCLLIFAISSIAFAIIGLKAPLLFGLFCGITNIIPYAGPYIGGAPAVIVALSQGTTTGILVLITIVIIQFLEGNFIQPLIMSKTTKLHPVTIIIGLLIFGHFFGIIGMAISTPIIAAFKAIFMFFDEKYNILNYND